MAKLSLFILLFSFQLLATEKTIIGEDQIERLADFDESSEIYQFSRATGRIKVPGPFGINDFCTVSLISEDLIVTAAHCFDKEKLHKWKVYFEYYDRSGKNKAPYKVKEFVFKDKELDIAVLRLTEPAGKKYGFYTIATVAPEIGSELLIVQHPALQPKSISRKDCFYKAFVEGLLIHTCDTENYSSGSPIFNNAGEIVAIHQGWVETDQGDFNYSKMIIDILNEI
jgi:V8-like Glu-specific endopeptidase